MRSSIPSFRYSDSSTIAGEIIALDRLTVDITKLLLFVDWWFCCRAGNAQFGPSLYWNPPPATWKDLKEMDNFKKTCSKPAISLSPHERMVSNSSSSHTMEKWCGVVHGSYSCLGPAKAFSNLHFTISKACILRNFEPITLICFSQLPIESFTITLEERTCNEVLSMHTSIIVSQMEMILECVRVVDCALEKIDWETLLFSQGGEPMRHVHL
ncbi:hypothetical protein KI387_043725, partial [Taxus chinensis]